MGKSTTFILNLQENLANLKLNFKFTKIPFTLSLVSVIVNVNVPVPVLCSLVLPYRSPQGVS